VNSVTLAGSGSETNGTIVGYSWTELSGPSSATVGTPTQASTTVGALLQGTYIFQLKVTDALGVTATDNMQVTVNPAPAVPGAPFANAGANQTITLPVNSVTLAGSGSETNGTIAAYSWTELSGPSTANIAAPTYASTAASGLVQGVYTFQLKVTDNSGVTATATVNVTVNAAPVVPGVPFANAGANQSITLPVNSVTLAGGGSEVNGTIVAYSWIEMAGPSAATISTPAKASTTVSGLVQGVYSFSLKVTDASGVTATDAMQVTVNPAATTPPPANVPPVANAGSNQTVSVSTAQLDGSASYDPDGNIVSYSWVQVSGLGGVTIVN